MKEKKSKHNLFYRISFWLMIYCLFTLTLGRFLPIYFQKEKINAIYYVVIHLLTLGSIFIVCFKRNHKPEKRNKIYALASSFIIGLGVSLILGVFTLFSFMFHYNDATTIYVSNSNPNLKIVSRFFDEGAFGGGSEPGDYEIVVLRPITPLLKIETSIDTTKMDKHEWIRQIYIRQ